MKNAMRLGLTLLMLSTVAACGDDDSSSTTADTTTPADTSTPDTVADTSTPDTVADTSAPDTVADTSTPDTVADTTSDSTGTTCDRNGFVAVAQDAAFAFGGLLYVAQDSSGAPVSTLNMELYPDFDGASEAGFYDLLGENYDECGNCVTANLNCDNDLANCEKVFLARSGTLDITALGESGGQFTGVLSVVLEEVTIDDELTSTVVSGGETWCIDNYAFDVTIQ